MAETRKHLRPTPAKSRAVRKIPKASKGHFVGELVYDDINGMPQRLGFASYTEFKAAICLIYRDDFADIEEQLVSLPFNHPKGAPSEHFFDFRFTTKGGQRICISVKPERIAKTYVYQATIGAVKKAAIGNICDAVATVTERNISPIELHNAELYHAARRPEIILVATGYNKVDTKLRSTDAWDMARHRFGLVGIKVLVIDECHHVFRAGPGRDIPAAIQALKHIMQSQHRVALIIAGVPSLKSAILSEVSGETLGRLAEFSLTRIRPGTRGATTFARNFVKSANTLALHVAEEDALPERILFAEKGQVGKSVRLGKEILRAAITRKREVITLEGAERVFRKSNSGLDVTPFDGAEWDAVKAELTAIGWGQ